MIISGKRIETKRLVISPFNENFLTNRYVEWLNDSENMRYSEQRFFEHTLESCRLFMESFDSSQNLFYAIVEKKEGLGHIGNLTVYVDNNNGIADISIMIGERSVLRKGLGFESFSCMCFFLLEQPGIRKITAGTMSVNSGMLRIMEKNGMVLDGVRRAHYLFEGKEIDLVHMALFKEHC